MTKNIYAAICTRDAENVSKVTHELITFFRDCQIKVLIFSGARSIFEAYSHALTVEASDDDIMILCHDDIEILDGTETFRSNLEELLEKPEIGFVGPAGTTKLGENAVWWDQELWKQGYHRGKVTHLAPKTNQRYETFYGDPSPVVALDGLFLAARFGVLKQVGLEKPEYFSGDWDFYDIHYTTKAHSLGFQNHILDMNIVHHSRGELVGRDSWHMNRAAFIDKMDLPIEV